MKNHLLGSQLVLIQQKDYHLQVEINNSFEYMDYNFQLTILATNLQPYQLKLMNFCQFVVLSLLMDLVIKGQAFLLNS